MDIPAGYSALETSLRAPAPGSRRVGPADPTETLSVSIRVRRRPDAPALPPPALPYAAGRGPAITREEFAAQYGALPADLEKVAEFTRSHGLEVLESSAARRTVVVSGTVEQMSRAFAVDLGRYQSDTESYRGREGHVHIPADLADIIEGVFGLDNRRMARPMNVHTAVSPEDAKAAGGPTLNTSPLTPPQVAGLYQFPAGTGTGETIGLLEFGGGYTPSDLSSFFGGLHLAVPPITPIGVDGASNSPGGGDDVEVTLDINVAGSVAPGAKIAVYFAPWTEQGWIDVVTTAVHDTNNHPSVLSISWGWSELETANGLNWTQQVIDAVSATFAEAGALGVTVLAASGDSGSQCLISDGKAHVNYPTSDPNVTSCGGTTIENVSGTSFTEVVWNDSSGATGGGVSDIFGLPIWQSWAGIPGSVNDHHVGRGVPDVAGNASRLSGYTFPVRGTTYLVGGTSAVAPLYAALVARLNAAIGEPVGFLNDNLYDFAGPYVYRDVNDGTSNAYGGAPGYTSRAGWDACTGWGSIVGNNVLNALWGVGRTPSLAVFNGAAYMAWKGTEEDQGIYWSSFNGTNWAAQKNVPGVGTSTGVSLAVFDNLLYMAWKGTDGDPGIYWSSFNGTAWAPQKGVAGVGTSVGPSLAVFNGALYMAWKGEAGDQGIYWSSFNGTTWSAQKNVPGVGTSVGASLAVFDNDLYMAWKGEFGDPGIYWSSFNGTAWAAQQNLPGVGTSEGPALAVFNGALFGVWKGEFGDQGLYWSHFDGAKWAVQQNIAGVGSSVGAGITVFDNALLAAWKGIFGDEGVYFSTFNGTTWAAQKGVPGIASSPMV